jgi:hypothetical protein
LFLYAQGTKTVEGLTLKLARENAKCFSTKAFKKMKRLRLLQLGGIQLDGDFRYLSKNLRWVHWNGFPLKCIPSSFYQGNLVSIELENSNIKLLWKETQVLIDFRFSFSQFYGHSDIVFIFVLLLHFNFHS